MRRTRRSGDVVRGVVDLEIRSWMDVSQVPEMTLDDYDEIRVKIVGIYRSQPYP